MLIRHREPPVTQTETPDVFDEYADSYEDAVRQGIGFAGVDHQVYLQAKANVLARLAATIGDPAGLSVLDVGCGVGLFARQLASRFDALHGADPSTQAVRRATDEVPAGTFTVSNDRLPYDDRSFDVTCAVCVFHHVPRAGRVQLLGEMRRVTRPGGLVAVFEHNPWNPLTRRVVSRVAFDADAELLTARETSGLFDDAGLRARSRYIMFVPSAGRAAAIVERVFGWLPAGAQYVTYATAA